MYGYVRRELFLHAVQNALRVAQPGTTLARTCTGIVIGRHCQPADIVNGKFQGVEQGLVRFLLKIRHRVRLE